jgi:hypothetical protein
LELAQRTYRLCVDFSSAVGNCIHNCPSKAKEALGNFKWLSQDQGRVDFAKNLHSSLFNEGSTFKQILRGEAQNSAFAVGECAKSV